MSRSLGFPNRKPRLLQRFVSRACEDTRSETARTNFRNPELTQFDNHESCSRIPSSLSSIRSTRTVEVWNTTCIVTNFAKKIREMNSSVATNRNSKQDNTGVLKHVHVSVLINPANPELSGVSKFPYFPRGGPVPQKPPELMPHHIMGYVSSWGGVNLQDGMLFPHSVVDGLVHEHGGWRLALECAMKGSFFSKNKICPVGQAVTTSPGGSPLCEEFDCLVHTVPPFYQHHSHPVDMLRSCYQSSFQAAFSPAHNSNKIWNATHGSNGTNSTVRVSSPLLGGGGRGFPLSLAIRIAAEESMLWKDTNDLVNGEAICKNDTHNEVIAFGIPDLSTAESLVCAMDEIDVC